MNNLCRSNLFSLLADTSQATNDEMRQAYETFFQAESTLNQ